MPGLALTHWNYRKKKNSESRLHRQWCFRRSSESCGSSDKGDAQCQKLNNPLAKIGIDVYDCICATDVRQASKTEHAIGHLQGWHFPELCNGAPEFAALAQDVRSITKQSLTKLIWAHHAHHVLYCTVHNQVFRIGLVEGKFYKKPHSYRKNMEKHHVFHWFLDTIFINHPCSKDKIPVEHKALMTELAVQRGRVLFVDIVVQQRLSPNAHIDQALAIWRGANRVLLTAWIGINGIHARVWAVRAQDADPESPGENSWDVPGFSGCAETCMKLISSSSEDAASSKGEKSCKAEVTSSSSWCQEKAAGGFRSDLGLTIEKLRNGNNSTMKACCPRVNYQINSLKETWVHSFQDNFPWIPQVIKSATSIKYSRMVVFSYTWVQPCHITQNGKQLTKLMCWYLCSWEFAGLHKTSDAQQLNVQYWKHDGVTVLG